MNFLPAQVVVENGAPALKLDGIILPLPADRASALSSYMGKKVEVGLRPEHFLAGDAETDFSIPVDMAELLGPTTLVHFTLAGVACAAMLAPQDARPDGGQQPLRIAHDRMSLFDPDTGRAI